MTDFKCGKWYMDSDKTKMWVMESRVETVDDHSVFVVSSFESWYRRTIPKNIAIINNDNPNIGVIQLQNGTVTINADEPIPDDMVTHALILAMTEDIKKAIDRQAKRWNIK